MDDGSSLRYKRLLKLQRIYFIYMIINLNYLLSIETTCQRITLLPETTTTRSPNPNPRKFKLLRHTPDDPPDDPPVIWNSDRGPNFMLDISDLSILSPLLTLCKNPKVILNSVTTIDFGLDLFCSQIDCRFGYGIKMYCIPSKNNVSWVWDPSKASKVTLWSRSLEERVFEDRFLNVEIW